MTELHQLAPQPDGSRFKTCKHDRKLQLLQVVSPIATAPDAVAEFNKAQELRLLASRRDHSYLSLLAETTGRFGQVPENFQRPHLPGIPDKTH